MITEGLKLEINNTLDSYGHRPEDFTLTTDNTSARLNIKIRYKYKEEYQVFFFNPQSSTEIRVEMVPGVMLNKETNYIGIEARYIKDKISTWLKNINAEMEAAPIVRKVKDHEERINKIEAHMETLGDMDEQFSNEELDELRSKLDEIQQNFKEQLEEYKQDNDQAIQDLQEDIRLLKNQATVLTKKNWLLSYSTRVYMLSQKHPAVTKLAGAVLYKMLPQDFQEQTKDLKEIVLPESTQK